MSNQSLRQASFRAIGGTTGTYQEDVLAAIEAEVPGTVGAFNERLLIWLNDRLVASHASLPAAMQAFAVSKGVANWNSLGTFA